MNAEHWCERLRSYLEVSDYAEVTSYGYLLEVRAFCQFLEDRKVEQPGEIQAEDINAYQLLLAHTRKPDGEPLTAGTRLNKLKALLVFFRFLYEQQFVLTDLRRHVKRPRVPDTLPPELPDEEQVLRLLEQPDTDVMPGRRDRAILELLYGSALRNKELRTLRMDHLDLHRLEVRVYYGKNGKSRLVPLSEPTAIWLEAYFLKERPLLENDSSGDLVFLNSCGRQLRKDKLSKIVRDHAQAAGLPMKVTPHLLRHSCATHMLARKAGIRHLQRFLGHTKTSSTERYTRVEVSDLREMLMRCHPRESC